METLVGVRIGPIRVIFYQMQYSGNLVHNLTHKANAPFFLVTICFFASLYRSSLPLLFLFCKHNGKKYLEKHFPGVL
jgi:hypothetical protein